MVASFIDLQHLAPPPHQATPGLVFRFSSKRSSLPVRALYLQGIDSAEIIHAVHARGAPMISVDASLRL
jgi:hypothetical protein